MAKKKKKVKTFVVKADCAVICNFERLNPKIIYSDKDYKHAQMRVRTMDRKALRTRIKRMKNPKKIAALIDALNVDGCTKGCKYVIEMSNRKIVRRPNY